MSRRYCIVVKTNGEPCKANPVLDAPYCHLHHPDHKEHMDGIRRARGQRDKKEASLIAAYNLQSLEAFDGLWRTLFLAQEAALSVEDPGERSLRLINIVSTGTSLKKLDIDRRLSALEATLEPRDEGDILPFRARKSR